MIAQNRRLMQTSGVAAVVLSLLACLVTSTTWAADKPVPSLDLVPADAAFYSSSLRNGEQWDAIVNSRGWAKLKALPYVQMGLGLYAVQTADPTSIPGQIETARANPDVQRSLKFLGQIFSDEVFVYAGPGFNDVVEVMQGVAGAGRFGPAFAELSGEAKGLKKHDIQAKLMLQALIDDLPRIKVPEMVFGFRVKDAALAKEQLARLETGLRQVLAGQKPFADRLKHETVAGNSYLVYTFDGNMIPWDDAVIEKIRAEAETPADADKLIAHIKSLKLVVSLGLRENYLLLAIGPSTDVLAKLGKGPSLRSLPELALLEKHAAQRIFNVSYMSKATNARLSSTKSNIDDLVKELKQALPDIKVPDKARKEIARDVTDLAGDLKKLIPEVGAQVALGFLTDAGAETYFYDWTEHAELDGSKPLGLLKHIGGSPIAALVNRTKVNSGGYDMLTKWIGVAYRYFQDYAVPTMKDKERAEFHAFMDKAKPLFQRLNAATRDSLLPALADGQAAIVLDAQLTSKQFLKQLPPTPKALPMFEPAIVVQVSDVEKLKKAFVEYWSIADAFVDILRQTPGTDIPASFKIPRPQVKSAEGNTYYTFPLPKDWGVSPRVLPNAGLSDRVAVLAITGKHSQRILTESEAKIAGRSLPVDKPLASAGGFDFAALVDVLAPWVDFGIDEGTKGMRPGDIDNVREHANTVLEVLKVYRGTVSETYIEGKAVVTHGSTEYHDIGTSAK